MKGGAPSKCYVCHPDTRKWDYYLDLQRVPGASDPAALFINQNLKGLQECVAVPRTHAGEFRLMSPTWSQRFWRALVAFLEALAAAGAQDLALEVSYGNWIVHKPGSPHYHAHVHIRCTQFAPALARLREQGIARREANTRPKEETAGDVERDISALAQGHVPALAQGPFLRCARDGHDLLPLFAGVAAWFPGLNGVLRISALDRTPSQYSIRTEAAAGAQLDMQLQALRAARKREREVDANAGALECPASKAPRPSTRSEDSQPQAPGQDQAQESAGAVPFPPLPGGWRFGKSRTYGNYFFYHESDEQTKAWLHPTTRKEYRVQTA